MNTKEWWRNFYMNSELHISGNFIYNGLSFLEGIESFNNDDEVFEILYSLSVGFERLMKVALVLTEDKNEITQDEYEQSLITHNHNKLLKRIEKISNIGFTDQDRHFLQILSKFYKKYRYDRYCLNSVKDFQKELSDFEELLNKGLQITLNETTNKMPRIKKFIGKKAKRIAINLYELIRDSAIKRGLFTYEIRFGSKAYKVFQCEEFTFFNEQIIAKELLLYFIKSKEKQNINNFLEDIEPLELEETDVLEAIDNLSFKQYPSIIRDYVQSSYDEMENVSSRIEQLKYFGSNLNYMFCEDEDFDDSEDEMRNEELESSKDE